LFATDDAGRQDVDSDNVLIDSRPRLNLLATCRDLVCIADYALVELVACRLVLARGATLEAVTASVHAKPNATVNGLPAARAAVPRCHDLNVSKGYRSPVVEHLQVRGRGHHLDAVDVVAHIDADGA